ncbi:omptin family outer membrane protease [Mesorhizobium sp. WSM2561]|uniref:omptin family outer membrane protease n=1 Tax=Mesorhizobium sp. WSM2561 TaxID=1040985 RepID=UPI001FD8AFB9|nr:omptin family outer membrane protease [Mesorhizobium sp. WSM2561]
MTPHNCDANEKIRITQKAVLAFTMSYTASQSLLGAVGRRFYRTCTAQLAENSGATLIALVAFCTSSSSAMAADQTIYAAPDDGIIFLGGVGYTWLKANELVLDEAGHHISQLIWETQAPVLTTGFEAEIDDRWTMSANAVVALSGNGHMEDYDWGVDVKNIEETPDNVDFTWDHWWDRSVHPDTRLDRYINIDIAVAHDFPIDNATILNLHGGFKYTNIKWTAYGGGGLQSYGGFRNSPVSWPPGQPVISYEQRFPGVFLGAEITTKLSDWTLSGLLRGGRMVHPEADDYHWGGGLFEDRFSSIDFISLGAKANYQVAESVSIFFAADFDRYLRERGDTTTFDAEGAQLDKGSAGMDFYAVTTSVGFKFKF